jgi:protein-disulfide isomerase
MSRKSKRNKPAQEAPARSQTAKQARASAQPQPSAKPQAPAKKGRAAIVIATAVVLLIAFVAGSYIYRTEKSRQADTGTQAMLARTHSPTLGSADAKVHIVEFLDPACETCAAFYPQVKRIMAANPGRIRLTVRHVPFHRGADQVVKALEAARAQGKYWEAVEAVLAAQDRWTVNHTADGERALPVIAAAGLDIERIRADMNSPEIAARIQQDLADAKALNVTKTPEFFVNGRALPSFGLDQLQALVRDELKRAYP